MAKPNSKPAPNQGKVSAGAVSAGTHTTAADASDKSAVVSPGAAVAAPATTLPQADDETSLNGANTSPTGDGATIDHEASKDAALPPPAKIAGLRIHAKKAGFRRAGRAWGVAPVDLPVTDFNRQQLAQLRAEPLLVVADIELDAPEAK